MADFVYTFRRDVRLEGLIYPAGSIVPMGSFKPHMIRHFLEEGRIVEVRAEELSADLPKPHRIPQTNLATLGAARDHEAQTRRDWDAAKAHLDYVEALYAAEFEPIDEREPERGIDLMEILEQRAELFAADKAEAAAIDEAANAAREAALAARAEAAASGVDVSPAPVVEAPVVTVDDVPLENQPVSVEVTVPVPEAVVVAAPVVEETPKVEETAPEVAPVVEAPEAVVEAPVETVAATEAPAAEGSETAPVASETPSMAEETLAAAEETVVVAEAAVEAENKPRTRRGSSEATAEEDTAPVLPEHLN